MRNSKLCSTALVPFLFLPFAPAQDAGPVDAAPAGRTGRTQSFESTFGPEVGDWSNEQLALPKFQGPADSTLVRAEVEICGQTAVLAEFQNQDDSDCTITFGVESDILMTPTDEDSPIDDFTLFLAVTGGPLQLGPGEMGMDFSDSGLVCGPVQTFTDRQALQFFVAGAGDTTFAFDHFGETTSEHVGCGVVDFHSDVDSTLTVRVTYTFVMGNQPPICTFVCDPIELCAPDNTSSIWLDASRATDPEKLPLTFLWTTSCPDTVIDDPTAEVTFLTIHHGDGPCEANCQITLMVSDGEQTSTCSDQVVLP